jgi:predicted transcriptional regulator
VKTLSVAQRRDNLTVMVQILEEARTPQCKTRIMGRLNITFAKNKKCINELLKTGLLENHSLLAHTLISTTKKGEQFLALYYKMMKMMDTQTFG